MELDDDYCRDYLRHVFFRSTEVRPPPGGDRLQRYLYRDRLFLSKNQKLCFGRHNSVGKSATASPLRVSAGSDSDSRPMLLSPYSRKVPVTRNFENAKSSHLVRQFDEARLV
jgi:hypothetical protein